MVMQNKFLRKKIALRDEIIAILKEGLKDIIGDGKCSWAHGATAYVCPVCKAKQLISGVEVVLKAGDEKLKDLAEEHRSLRKPEVTVEITQTPIPQPEPREIPTATEVFEIAKKAGYDSLGLVADPELVAAVEETRKRIVIPDDLIALEDNCTVQAGNPKKHAKPPEVPNAESPPQSNP